MFSPKLGLFGFASFTSTLLRIFYVARVPGAYLVFASFVSFIVVFLVSVLFGANVICVFGAGSFSSGTRFCLKRNVYCVYGPGPFLAPGADSLSKQIKVYTVRDRSAPGAGFVWNR